MRQGLGSFVKIGQQSNIVVHRAEFYLKREGAAVPFMHSFPVNESEDQPTTKKARAKEEKKKTLVVASFDLVISIQSVFFFRQSSLSQLPSPLHLQPQPIPFSM